MSWRKFVLALVIAFATGAAAYVILLPRYIMIQTEEAMTASNVEQALPAYNALRHGRALLGPDFRAVVKPNNDTLYSTTILDLENGPLKLTLPPTGERYWSVQVLNMTSGVSGVVSRRTDGGSGTVIYLVPKGWDGEAPEDGAMIEVPDEKGWLILRYLIEGPRDLAAVHALQDATVLEPWEPRAATDEDS